MKVVHSEQDVGPLRWSALIAAAVILSGGAAFANGTVWIPEEWSFEAQTPGTPIVDTNGVGILGWEGVPLIVTNHPAKVVAIAVPEPSNGYPLPEETHDNAIRILGNIQANFDTNQTAGPTNVLIDCVIQAGQLNFQPDAPESVQVAMYFNTNGLLVVRHAVYTNDFQAVFRYWTEINHTPVGSNDWVRLTVTMDYLTSGTGPFGAFVADFEHFYSIALDGVTLESPFAYTNALLSSATVPTDPASDGYFPSTGQPGTKNQWFLCADSGFGDQGAANQPNNKWFSGIEFNGAGYADDILVTAEGVNTNTPIQTPYQIWISEQGVGGQDGPDDDPDGDTVRNYDEYLAGTDPNDPNSLFKVIVQQFVGGSNCVTWIGTTNTPVTSSFMMLRSTNLLDDSEWLVIQSGIPRNPTGTNVWYDGTPPDVPTYYQPALPTNAP